jgi:predicted kinase
MAHNSSAPLYAAPAALVMVVGVPGSGKTVLAKALARMLSPAAYISKDLIQNAFTAGERATDPQYSMVKGPAYRILLDFADLQLSLGKTPVIDAPFSINHWRADELADWLPPFREVAVRHGALLKIIRCLPASEEQLESRLRERNLTRDRWKLENWTEFLRREPLRFPIPHDDVFEVVTDAPADVLAARVLREFLDARE